MLELCHTHKITTFINADTILDRRVNIYSQAKKQFVEWLQLFSNQFICINLSIEQFYGPGDNKNRFCTKIVTDLLNQVNEIKLTQGEQKRDFIYITDVINAFMSLIKFSQSNKPGFYQFDAGTGNSITIKEFISLACQLTGNKNTKLNYGALPYRSNEIMEYPLNSTPLKNLGWVPQVNLKQGLQFLIAAVQQEMEQFV